LRTVITYGTFDTFHYGHMELLRRASALGNFLIVGVSTDEFNTNKGKSSRFCYEKRKEWVESIRFVDLVIPECSWGQKETDIYKHNVDVFTIGEDWAGKFNSLPCKVVYLPRTSNISSTAIKGL
jgi:glycerol-3-phosphate cytidylyltransferase